MTKRQISFAALVFLSVLLLAGAAWAGSSSSFSVDLSVLSGGGAPSTAGNVSAHGTLGQIAIGSSMSTGATHELGAGFWYGTAVEGAQMLFLPIVLHGS